LLKELEGRGIENLQGKESTLLESLDKLVAFQRRCAEDPSLQRYRRKRNPYKSPEERRESKKWEDRKICFEDKNYV